MHTLLFVLIALLWQSTKGSRGQEDDTVGIAVVDPGPVGDGQFDESGGGGSLAGAQETVSTSLESALSQDAGPPISVDAVLSQLIGADANGPPSGDNGTSGHGLSGDGNSGTGGSGKGLGGSGKTKTSFFGVEGTGASFVYVMDRSDSMNVYQSAPLRFAKREARKSLESLNDYNQFQVIFYNDSLYPLGNKMVFATDSDKRRASNFIQTMPGDGGTEHLPALKLALTMGPDVIFFLTDADDPSLSMSQLLQIQSRTELTGTTIHTIQFNVGPATNDGSWIRALAEMNRGTYKYVDVSTFSNQSIE